MKTFYQIAISVVAAMTVASCAADPVPADEQAATAETTQGLTCTPGAQQCDFGCFYQGGPSSDDCIVQCSADGKRWESIYDCGWAQNWPYSSSCLNAQPHPRCENN